jgi:hypothetical protein
MYIYEGNAINILIYVIVTVVVAIAVIKGEIK